MRTLQTPGRVIAHGHLGRFHKAVACEALRIVSPACLQAMFTAPPSALRESGAAVGSLKRAAFCPGVESGCAAIASPDRCVDKSSCPGFDDNRPMRKPLKPRPPLHAGAQSGSFQRAKRRPGFSMRHGAARKRPLWAPNAATEGTEGNLCPHFSSQACRRRESCYRFSAVGGGMGSWVRRASGQRPSQIIRRSLMQVAPRRLPESSNHEMQ